MPPSAGYQPARRISSCPTTSLVVFWMLAAAAWGAGEPRVVYTKVFPGSAPAYVSITVDQSGAVSYKESAEEEEPEKFDLEPAATAAIFELAGKLDHFNRKLESGLKVANLGQKTFRWEDAGAASEAKFNYSQDDNARQLQDWFERITETERSMLELKHALRYDKLGVYEALLKIETIWNAKRLAGAAQMLPLLDRVAQNDTYLHMARERAANLAAAIRAQKGKG
ncbi:MAG TPA: hypothetical protein VN841_06580 [Bryobacteraceae bacterium]|nr:hypothetical protein [Bryobacteraceae bacterium]